MQKGYMDMFTGIMTGIRNPNSHQNMNPDENLTIHFLFLVSFMTKKFEESGIIKIVISKS